MGVSATRMIKTDAPRLGALGAGTEDTIFVSIAAYRDPELLRPSKIAWIRPDGYRVTALAAGLVGLVFALFATSAGVVATLAKRLPAGPSMMLGGAVSAIAMALLALSASRHALPIFLAAVTATGAGYSLLFLGGLGSISAKAPDHHRGAVLSALYLVAYLAQGVIALLLGAAATAWGLEAAIDLGTSALALLSMSAIVLAASLDRRTVA